LEVGERVNKEIAHLTLGRLLVGPAAKSWDIAAIHREMVILLNLFLGHAPSAATIVVPSDPLPTPPILPRERTYSTASTTHTTTISTMMNVRSIATGPSHSGGSTKG
jgi:hypothetical protein